MNTPAFQFYPGDYLRDPICGCSLAAQGLWLRLLMLMHDSERYGYLCHNGSPIPPQMLARRCGCSLEEFNVCLAELEAAGIPSRTENGIIYCRRMARAEEQRENHVERQRRYREKNRDKNVRDAQNVTRDAKKHISDVQSDAWVTPPTDGIGKPVSGNGDARVTGSVTGMCTPSSSSTSTSTSNTTPTETPVGVEPVDNFYDGKELWEVGKELLVNQGMSQRSAGAFIGKLCSDYGKPQVLEAVRVALVNKPVDVASYLPGILKRCKGVNGTEFKSIQQLRHEALVRANEEAGKQHALKVKQEAINKGRGNTQAKVIPHE
jgi:hypothetical protein